MLGKVEYKINKEVANFMVENYEWVVNTSVEAVEDYKPYDIVYTASTETKEWVSTQEVKSIRGYPLKENGKFRDYFKKDIKNKMMFGNVPSLNKELPKYWYATPTDIGIPKNIEGKPVYFLNATDVNGCIYNSKWYHILQNNTGLTIAAKDGIVMFSPGQLKKAFITYAWYWQPAHTELYNKKYDPHWELKAIIDLSKGSYYEDVINKELFKKY
jgi:hypothetical protein